MNLYNNAVCLYLTVELISLTKGQSNQIKCNNKDTASSVP